MCEMVAQAGDQRGIPAGAFTPGYTQGPWPMCQTVGQGVDVQVREEKCLLGASTPNPFKTLIPCEASGPVC